MPRLTGHRGSLFACSDTLARSRARDPAASSVHLIVAPSRRLHFGVPRLLPRDSYRRMLRRATVLSPHCRSKVPGGNDSRRSCGRDGIPWRRDHRHGRRLQTVGRRPKQWRRGQHRNGGGLAFLNIENNRVVPIVSDLIGIRVDSRSQLDYSQSCWN